MDKFVVRSKRLSISSNGSSTGYEIIDGTVGESSEKRARVDIKCEEDIISDPALRKPINEYDTEVRDLAREGYMARGPCQPFKHDFPRRDIGNKMRCFQIEWFHKWEWLEYSVSKDAAFCFWCCLFNGDIGKRFGDGVFVKTGFRNWKKATERFRDHEGVVGSTHNKARALFFAFRDQKESLTRNMSEEKQVVSDAHRSCLNASVDFIRLLLEQDLTFDSFAQQLTCPPIQKEYVSACASQTTKVIIAEIGHKCFSLLIGETRDSLKKEQMIVVLRYVNNYGAAVERFLGVFHAFDNTAPSLKSGIYDFFAEHGLSFSKVRGQGYDRTCNMRGEFNELKTLILNENPCARYIHCFSHHLHLVIVDASLESQSVSDFFEYFYMIINMVGSSCKINDDFLQKQHENMVEKLENGETSTMRGLNQQSTLAWTRATRWGSHYTSVVRLLSLWSSVIQVLENILHDGTEFKTRGFADSLIQKMESYQFVFVAHLMKLVLGLTNMLSRFLQQKDRNVSLAVSLVQNTKRKLKDLRENGWNDLLSDVNNFCATNDIIILKMEDYAQSRRRSRCALPVITWDQYFRVEIFCQVIDQIVQEMAIRFSEPNIELLTCISCLDPKNSFRNFRESKLLQLAELYPQDFSLCDRMELKEQLQIWICEMRSNEIFSDLQSIEDVAKKMVELGIHTCFHLVYRLIELVLVLPVVTASMERDFCAMSIMNTDLRNIMGDDFLSEWLVCFTEEDIFRSIDDEAIKQHFQNIGTREINLPLSV